MDAAFKVFGSENKCYFYTRNKHVEMLVYIQNNFQDVLYIHYKCIQLILPDEKGQDGKLTVLNSERLKGGNGTLKVIHGYAIPSADPGKLKVNLEGVPVNADCK